MKVLLLLVVGFFVIAGFHSDVRSQKANFLNRTTAATTQVTITEVDKITDVLIGTRDPSRTRWKADYSPDGPLFSVDVSLKIGDNKFVLELYNKDDYVMSIPVTIRRVAIGEAPKGAADADAAAVLNSSNTAIVSGAKSDTNRREQGKEILLLADQSSSVTIPTSYARNPDPVQKVDAELAVVRKPTSTDVQKEMSGTAKPKVDEGLAPEETNKFMPDLRLLFGFEQVGASSTASRGQPFIDLLTEVTVGSQPFKYRGVPKRFKTTFWTNLKLTSTPSQVLPNFGGLTDAAVTGFFGSNESSKVNDIVQSFQARIGLEESLGRGFGLIAGVGATSPLAAEKTVSVFKIPRLANGDVRPEFKEIFGNDQDFTGLNNLILTSGDRDRFSRNWFVGGRLRSKFFSGDPDVYPAVFELTVGQDELMTNTLRGAVLKFDSFVPVPIKGLKFLYFGATFNSRLTRKVNTSTLPFFLESVPNPNLSSNDNYVRNFRDIRELNSDRDSFSFRFGVDLIQLLRKSSKKEEAPSKDRTAF